MDKKTLVTTLVGLVLFVGFLALMNRIHHPPQTKEQELERLISFFNSPEYHDGFVHKEYPWGDDVESRRTRSRAAGSLREMGEDAKDAIPALIHALQNEPSGSVRKSMVFALVDIGKSAKNITFALIQALQNDSDEDVRYCVALILSEDQEYMMGENAKDVVPALIQVLQNDDDGEVRACAAGALDGIGENARNAVPALIQVLQHNQDSGFRAYVASVLVKIGTAEAIKAAKGVIPDLIKLLQHEHRLYHSSAANALRVIGTPEALKALEGYNHKR